MNPGVPARLLGSEDFITLRMALVDQVGLDAAMVLERVRWRCEIRDDGWVATYADLMRETRLSRRRVLTAVTALRDLGWLVSENAGQATRTLRWQVPIVPERADHNPETELCTPYREDLGEHPTPPTPRPLRPHDEAAASLVAAWSDAYFDSMKRKPPAAVIEKVRVDAVKIARACAAVGEVLPVEQVGQAGATGRYSLITFLAGGEVTTGGRVNHDLAALRHAINAGALDGIQPLSLDPTAAAETEGGPSWLPPTRHAQS